MAITVKDKAFTFPSSPIIIQGEKGTQTLEFEIQDTLPSGAELYLCFCNSKGESEVQEMTASGTKWTWTVNVNFTAVAGYNAVQLMAKVEDTLVWETKKCTVAIHQNVMTDEPVADLPNMWIELIEARDTAVTKASEASASATSAAASASTASSKATEASGYADNAEESADSAEESASSAESAKTAAAGSATSAAGSATTASTKAAEATESASEAAASATSAESAKTDAVSAKELAVSAKNDAISAKETAVSAKTTAEEKATEAAGSATSAATSATNAATSAINAAASEAKAEEWAEKDTAVETGKYSAKHWADYAEETVEDLVKYDNVEAGSTVPINADQLNGHADSYFAVKAQSGASIGLSLSSDSFVLSIQLKDVNNNVISEQTVDFPIESLIQSGYYDESQKSLVLVLKNGNTITIPLNGVATQTELTTHTSRTDNPHSVTKLQVGLGNVPDTGNLSGFTDDLGDEPVHTHKQYITFTEE